MMKVLGSYSRNVTVNVTARDALTALQSEVLMRMGLRGDYYLDKKGRVVYDEEHGGHHSYSEEKVVIKTPTDEQVNILKAFATVNEALRKLDEKTQKSVWPHQ